MTDFLISVILAGVIVTTCVTIGARLANGLVPVPVRIRRDSRRGPR